MPAARLILKFSQSMNSATSPSRIVGSTMCVKLPAWMVPASNDPARGPVGRIESAIVTRMLWVQSMGWADGASRKGPVSFCWEWWVETTLRWAWMRADGRNLQYIRSFPLKTAHFGLLGPVCHGGLMSIGWQRPREGRMRLEIPIGVAFFPKLSHLTGLPALESAVRGENSGLFWIPVPFCPILSRWACAVLPNGTGLRARWRPETFVR